VIANVLVREIAPVAVGLLLVGRSGTLALVEIAWGVLMVIAAIRPVAGRSLMVLLGAAATVFGALILLDAWQHRFHDWFGVHDDNGWLILAAGVVTLLASFVLPIVTTPGQRVVRERTTVGS